MKDDGKIFITVPNGRSLFEIAWRIDLIIARATKRYLRPGEPHVQRNSPGKWSQIIEESGFLIRKHEMEIGFFVNTASALVQLLLTFGERVLRKMALVLMLRARRTFTKIHQIAFSIFCVEIGQIALSSIVIIFRGHLSVYHDLVSRAHHGVSVAWPTVQEPKAHNVKIKNDHRPSWEAIKKLFQTGSPALRITGERANKR
jgi:hypothetical protein